MKIALYQGISPTSRAIRFITRSNYSHAAFLFDNVTAQAARELRQEGQTFASMPNRLAGAIVEAWEPGGVRNRESLSSGHEAKTTVDIFALNEPLTVAEEKRLLIWLLGEIGAPYNFRGVIRFVTKRPGNKSRLDNSWFCSEMVFEGLKPFRTLFSRTQGWQVPPDLLQRSPLVYYESTVITG